MVCRMHSVTLNLRDKTLGHGHDTPFFHEQHCVKYYPVSNMDVEESWPKFDSAVISV